MTQTTLPERVKEWTQKYCESLMENYLQTNGERWSQGVHAFVDKNTGEVYKPASWKSPAQYVRFDMRIINQREQLHNPRFTDWAGGHLYLR